MTARFAWPVCNRPAGDYDVVAGDVCLGRPFRQPLQLPDAANFADGLELWLRDAPDTLPIFACFRGRLEFHPTAGSQPARLRLIPELFVRTDLWRLGVIEAVPEAFMYVNVDPDGVRQRLINLLTTAYSSAIGPMSSWHPAMRNFRFRPPPAVPPHPRFKVVLDAAAAANRLLVVIGQAVDHVLANSGSNPNARLPVLEGDRIGAPATAFGGAAPPAMCGLVGAVPPPRHLVFIVEERGARVRNPLYDLWTWLNSTGGADPPITLLAPHQIGSANPHPIARVTGLTLTPPKPSARVETTAALRPIPLGNLNSFHHRDNSRIAWRLTNDGLLETQLRPNQPGPTPNLTPTAGWQNLVHNTMWNQYRNDIIDMSTRFQVPAELIMGFLGHETGSLDKRDVRFESVDNAHRKAEDAAVLSNPVYDVLRAEYANVIPGNGFSATVPDPWNPAAVIRTVDATQFTWGEMAQLLDLSPYFRRRISPGLMQTLISTAASALDWVNRVWLDIVNVDPRIAVAPPDWSILLGVAARPPNWSGYLNDWLLVPRQSILVGTAYIRMCYNADPEGTFWDPPRVAAAYNAGRVKNPCIPAGAPDPDMLRTWGMCYYGDYMAGANAFGAMYNLAVQLFNVNGTLVPAPTVRLRR